MKDKPTTEEVDFLLNGKPEGYVVKSFVLAHIVPNLPHDWRDYFRKIDDFYVSAIGERRLSNIRTAIVIPSKQELQHFMALVGIELPQTAEA